MIGGPDFFNPSEEPTLSGKFKRGEELVYPGLINKGNRIIQNLCSYREGTNIQEINKPGDSMNGIIFDVERTVTWDKTCKLLPFAYSIMIDRFYPSERGPTLEKFTVVADQLLGFTHKPNKQKYTPYREYVNPEGNLFINWSIDNKGVCIGVIQKNPIPELDRVVVEIIPYAVEVFNQLSPDRQLSQDVLKKSVAIARESDKILPRRRGSKD